VDAASLFERFFLPLYPPDARAELARARAEDANAANNPSILAHLEDAAARFAANAPALFGAVPSAASAPRDLRLDLSDASVHRLSAAIGPEVRDAWAAQGEPGTAESALFNAVVHGAAYVGACIVASHGGVWGVRRPLWESVVRLRSRAGEADLAVFHWWLKSLADDGRGATLADRYRAHVEVPCARPEERAIFVAVAVSGAGDRRLPRLQKPSYHSLHKYVRAHLPELRDLGDDFPSPERFEAFELRWIDAHVLGGGRMVLFAGASPHGLHLFWMGAEGFEKSAFVPCDAFPDPVVRLEDDRLVALTSENGATRTHEMLWWGI
jgi:hypothetical protein